jgi:TolB-like protein/class 3 adenylate cyclase/Tfp pilus assembly protein PilF
MVTPGQGRIERRLAAILAADVAGYSRLMGADEAGTAQALREHRAAVDPIVASHGGRIVKTTGDGVLLEFSSIVAAVECAMAVQKLMAERNSNVPEDRRMLFRIGINLGDVLIEGDDILGDGVNIAARLEGIAEPGGICIPASAYDHVLGKVDAEFADLGEQSLKNIARPVRVYRVLPSGAVASQQPVLPLPDKPSIAVLPFQNISGDPEQEYFADGMVEEIITALSRFKNLFVIARNSSFTYRGRAVNVKQVSRELGVRYVLEGSVRKTANRVRITGQLVDTATGAHIWADRFDGALEDVFDLQDRVTASVVGAIVPQVVQAEIERSKRKPTASLDAYDYYLRGTAKVIQGTKEAYEEALQLLYRAIELDHEFALPHALAAMCYAYRKGKDYVIDQEQKTETARLAWRGVALDKDDALVLCYAGCSLAYVVGELDEGAALIDRALLLNPNLVRAWNLSGWVQVWLGNPETAIEHLERAVRLSPLDSSMYAIQTAIAHAHFFAGRYDEASSWAAQALRQRQDFLSTWHIAAASSALAGRMEEAKKACSRLQQLDPALRVSSLRNVLGPYRRPEDRSRYEEGLRKAGLPA